MKKHMHNGHDHDHQLTAPKTPWTDWLPLVVVLAFIAVTTAVIANLTAWTLWNILSLSMGFFFLYFALFKLINLPGFVMGYREYDILAMRFRAWAYAYPFIEVAIGLLYISLVDSLWLNLFTIALTLLNCAGIVAKLVKHEVFQCACLGTVLKVPLTKVSLVEYAAMGLMAVVMLAI